MKQNDTLRSSWLNDMKWTLTDRNKEDSETRTAQYSAEQIFELLSRNIFNTTERDDFKRLSVALSDYLKTVNFSEEINALQLAALALAFGYYYRKLEEKHIVKIEGKSNEESIKDTVDVETNTKNTERSN
jgi:hypothetical protein